MTAAVRPEYPRPQFVRKEWMNLNGLWQFEIDNTLSGKEKGWADPEHELSGSILVPFCPESTLSGIGNRDFMRGVWYRRTVSLTEQQLCGRVLLHFGACDYETEAYVNGILVGTHRGGYVSFCFDVTKAVRKGENVITVFARDDVRDKLIPSGKQSDRYHSYEALYTRTTGIWQTVWLEFTPEICIESFRMIPDIAMPSVTIQMQLRGKAPLSVVVQYKGKEMGTAEFPQAAGCVCFTIPLAEKHLWEIGQGRLYDLVLRFGDDEVRSYFGLRTVRFDGMTFLLNEKPVFQRLVLDQGFYPDGIYTAPSDEALERDIHLARAMGFQGARLHEKIFEERYLYHCDRLGYLAWGEYPDWGCDDSDPENIYAVLPEWMEEIRRDFNHPSIIGWCPHNETGLRNRESLFAESIRLVYRVTKELDPTRPCIDASGFVHVQTDVFDTHDYEQDADVFERHYRALDETGELFDNQKKYQRYGGQPIFISEYGGIQWAADAHGWGYGNAPKTPEEFCERFRRLTQALLRSKKIFALCYTQLTDVEQEQNGLYTYDRRPKFDPGFFAGILSETAAIEKDGEA